MKKKLPLILLIFIISASSCSKCEYASFKFFEDENEEPSQVMQLLLYSITIRTIELLVYDYKTEEPWDFTKGDKIVFNDHLTIEFDEENELPDSQESFYSKDLTDAQMSFFLDKWIKKITIYNRKNSITAELSPDQSEHFREVLNCLYDKDRESYEDLIN